MHDCFFHIRFQTTSTIVFTPVILPTHSTTCTVYMYHHEGSQVEVFTVEHPFQGPYINSVDFMIFVNSAKFASLKIDRNSTVT